MQLTPSSFFITNFAMSKKGLLEVGRLNHLTRQPVLLLLWLLVGNALFNIYTNLFYLHIPKLELVKMKDFQGGSALYSSQHWFPIVRHSMSDWEI